MPSVSYPATSSTAARSYQPLRPCANKTLTKKWDDHRLLQHVDKVKHMKASVDASPPRTYKHIEHNLKKEQQELERMEMMKRHDRVLRERVEHILRSHPMPNGPVMERTGELSTRWRREQERIAAENQAIRMRIQTRQGHYDHRQWEREREQQLTYLRTISAFPEQYEEHAKKSESRRPRTYSPPQTRKLIMTAEAPVRQTTTAPGDMQSNTMTVHAFSGPVRNKSGLSLNQDNARQQQRPDSKQRPSSKRGKPTEKPLLPNASSQQRSQKHSKQTLPSVSPQQQVAIEQMLLGKKPATDPLSDILLPKV